jgi:hypothetical protein
MMRGDASPTRRLLSLLEWPWITEILKKKREMERSRNVRQCSARCSGDTLQSFRGGARIFKWKLSSKIPMHVAVNDAIILQAPFLTRTLSLDSPIAAGIVLFLYW